VLKLSQVTGILDQLRECPAGRLETQTLEFKGWCQDEKELSRVVAEATVCLANTEGGLVIVGVDDRSVGSAAILPCPYPAITSDWFRMRIRDLTRPPVPCQVLRLSEPPFSLRGNPAADLFVIQIERKKHASGHRTSQGVSFVRTNTECRPEYYTERDDFSELLAEHLGKNALNSDTIVNAAHHRESRFPDVRQLGNRPWDHLSDMDLLRRLTRESAAPSSRVPTVAALLLFGTEKAIHAELPNAETVFADETSQNNPLTSSRTLNIIESVGCYLPQIKSHLRKMEVEVPEEVISELLFNAYIHRCYRTAGAVHISLRSDEIEIQNPGGLLGSLTVENLLHATPIYRNLLLAEAARQYGYCDKAGTGINRVYFQSLAHGLDFPVMESTLDSFSVTIRTKRDKAFAMFIRDFAGTLNLRLNDLIVLRALRARVQLSVAALCKLSQRPESYMDDVLSDLVRRSVIERHGDDFVLSGSTRSAVERYSEDGQLRLL